MLPVLHFGLKIQDNPELQKHQPSHTVLKESLNHLRPVLSDEYVITIQNDNEHSYNGPAYTLLLHMPERPKAIEIDRIEPEKDRKEVGYAALFTFFEYSTHGKEQDTPEYSLLDDVPTQIQDVCSRLLSRFEAFFGPKYIFSFAKGEQKEIALKLKKAGERSWETLREFNCPHSDIDIETRQLSVRAIDRYFKKHPY